MRIGFDVSWMNIQNISGGVFHHALRLITALVTHSKFTVTAIIGPTGIGVFDHLKDYSNFHTVLLGTIDIFGDIIAAEKIDIVHTPVQFYQNYTLSVPMINTLHDLQHFHYPEFFTKEEIKFRNTFYRVSAEFSERVIVSFAHVKEDIIKFYQIPADKIVACPFGSIVPRQIDESRFEQLKAQYSLGNKYIIYAANTWRHKNHASLIKALKQLQDEHKIQLQLVCTGYQFDDYYPELQNLIEELGLKKSVIFTGYIPQDDVILLLKNASLAVIPTFYEAGSFALMEAMAYEVPVICSNVTSLPETIGDHRFIFDPANISEMADKIAMMLGDEKLLKENRENSRKKVGEASWEKAVPHFIDTYQKAIEDFRPKRNIPHYANWLLNYEFMAGKTLAEQRRQFELCEIDRAARLEVINAQAKDFTSKFNESEKDRASRLEVIQSQGGQIAELQKTLDEQQSSLHEYHKYRAIAKQACAALYKTGGDLHFLAKVFRTEKIVFGKEEASLFLHSGWGQDETFTDDGSTVNWAIGKAASLFLALPKDAARLTVNVRAFELPKPQEITVKIDNKELGKWTLSNKWQWEQHSMLIKPDNERKAVSIVEFIFSQNIQLDDRDLAVLFESLTIDR